MQTVMNRPLIRILTADVSVLEDAALFARYYSRMPDERKKRIDRFRFDRDKRLSLGVGILLEEALNAAGYAPPFPETAVGEHEKPYFPEIADRFRFNLSHSGTKVMCISAACDPGNVPEVGCDVEQSIGGDVTALAKRFFHAEETALLLRESDPAARAELFRRLWTLKESFIKATGEGLSRPLDSFFIEFAENGGIRVNSAGDGRRFRFGTWQSPDGAAYAWCAALPPDCAEPEVIWLPDDHQTWGK